MLLQFTNSNLFECMYVFETQEEQDEDEAGRLEAQYCEIIEG